MTREEEHSFKECSSSLLFLPTTPQTSVALKRQDQTRPSLTPVSHAAKGSEGAAREHERDRLQEGCDGLPVVLWPPLLITPTMTLHQHLPKQCSSPFEDRYQCSGQVLWRSKKRRGPCGEDDRSSSPHGPRRFLLEVRRDSSALHSLWVQNATSTGTARCVLVPSPS